MVWNKVFKILGKVVDKIMDKVKDVVYSVEEKVVEVVGKILEVGKEIFICGVKDMLDCFIGGGILRL